MFKEDQEEEKEKKEEDEVEEYPEENLTFDEDDIRSLLLAERVDSIFRGYFCLAEIRDDLPAPGKEEEYNTYKKVATVRTIAMIVLLIEVILGKPQWCRDKGQNMDVEDYH